ncbi:hypothetical protein [Streptomyces sp. NPDC088733]|uniref:hypothetical protein n=1 Tax=Streptomyces sp. NPDC088733 TaxID=3365880 RepID=UPI0037FEF4FF
MSGLHVLLDGEWQAVPGVADFAWDMPPEPPSPLELALAILRPDLATVPVYRQEPRS